MKFHEFSDRIVFHFWGIFHDPPWVLASLTSSSRQVAARRDARPEAAKLGKMWWMMKGGNIDKRVILIYAYLVDEWWTSLKSDIGRIKTIKNPRGLKLSEQLLVYSKWKKLMQTALE